MKIYVPFKDKELIIGAARVVDRHGGELLVHGQTSRCLSTITAKDTLYVLGHGRYSRGDQICGEVPGYLSGTRSVKLTAGELAKQLVSDGLTTSLGDLRLMMCWGGYGGGTIQFDKHTLTRNEAKPPFAGQLCSAMKARGYTRIIVTGYSGMVLFPNAKGAVPEGIWLTNKSGNLVITDDKGSQSLWELMKKATGKTGTLDNANRTVWY